MASEAARGMLHLHRQRPSIIHRDLKSPNLFVAKGLHVKVGCLRGCAAPQGVGCCTHSLAAACRPCARQGCWRSLGCWRGGWLVSCAAVTAYPPVPLPQVGDFNLSRKLATGGPAAPSSNIGGSQVSF
jgi:serine/threonine protein kinase